MDIKEQLCYIMFAKLEDKVMCYIAFDSQLENEMIMFKLSVYVLEHFKHCRV